jgi:glucose/arabinose dehydrogenase
MERKRHRFESWPRGCRATALLGVLLLAGCGGGGSGAGEPPPSADTVPPTVPQGVSASAASTTDIVVNWQASTDSGTGVAGYRVYRNGAATAIATVPGTSFTDSGLAAATQYSYTVRAFDAATPANESALSTAAIATTSTSQGLDARPDNQTCVAGARPAQAVTLATERVFASLPAFSSPVLLLQAPGDAARWFVVEQGGTVRVFDNQPAVTTSRSFVDISARVRSGGEQGLLGMAFHPGFPADPRVYLSYTNATNGLVSRISEFRSRDGGATLDPASEVILLTVAQPATNHNGGNIAFGPDGLLYIGFGDGGSGGDPWGTIGNGQNLLTTLGKLLRIDIGGSTGGVPYRIPAGNPYAGNALCNGGTGAQNCPEIFAYGLRNPWRWSFDRVSGELWLADVGQGTLEEVNRITVGGNYGWRCFEGTGSYNSTCGPNAASSIAPIAQYGRAVGQSVTGGYVYRGTALPALVGRYVFGDFVTGRIWHIARDTTPTLTVSA